MHRSERLSIILRLLLDRSGVTVESLCSQLKVSPRSLYRDLKLLRDQGYPIEGSVGRGGGIRLHPSYGLSKIQLSTEQSIGMLLSLAIGEKLGLPFFSEQLRPARQKITQAFAESQRAIVRRLQERVFVGDPASVAVVSSYKMPSTKITRAVELAFLREQKLAVQYVNEKEETTKRTIEPHGIFVNFPAWYLIAYDDLRRAPRTFRLDRINGAAILDVRFRPKAQELFQDLVGSNYGSNI